MVVLLVAFSMQPVTWAVPTDAGGALIEVGNKICPISGQKVGMMGDPIQVEHDGKLYNLCCAGCKSTFLEDPAKYSKIAQAHVNIQTEGEGMMPHGEKGSSDMHGGHGMQGDSHSGH